MRGIPFRKWFLTFTGILAVLLGTIGIFVPLLPTTPFLLVAAACFLRSSSRLHGWLMNHRILGPYLRQYREKGAVTRHSKILTILLLWISLGYSAFVMIQSLAMRILLLAIGIAVSAHILRLKTMKKDEMRSSAAIEDPESG